MELFSFQPDDYGDVGIELLSSEDLPLLSPGAPQRFAADRLGALTVDELFQDVPLRDREMALCCLSAIWLWFDFLDESHRISQNIDTTSGSLLHGIMHRREPDYSNAKYWFRKAGTHPIFDPLANAARPLMDEAADTHVDCLLADGGCWDAIQFVDVCQRYAGADGRAETVCRKIARVEWQLLFDHCYRRAIGR